MSNSSGNSNQKTFSILFQPTITFLSLSYTIIALGIILNSLEIKLIVTKLKKATDFEIMLLNLALADLLNCVLFMAITVVVQKSKNEKSVKFTSTVNWVTIFMSFSMIASVTFVIIIGLERFFAIKVPLQHRLWHTSRKTLARNITFTWLFDIILVASLEVINHLIVSGDQTKVSFAVTYLLTGLLTFGTVLILVLYTWVLYLMILRSIKMFDFDKNILRINPKMIKDAMKKERSSIIICTLVVLSFMTSNIPVVIDLYQFQFTMTSAILLKVSAVANPLIYFFKGYLERRFAKQKLSSSQVHTEESKKGKKKNGESIEMIEDDHTAKSLGLKNQEIIIASDAIGNSASDRGEVDNNEVAVEIQNDSRDEGIVNDS